MPLLHLPTIPSPHRRYIGCILGSGVTNLRFLTNKALWHRQTLAVAARLARPSGPQTEQHRATYRLTSGASLPPRLIAWLRFLLNADVGVWGEGRSRVCGVFLVVEGRCKWSRFKSLRACEGGVALLSFCRLPKKGKVAIG